MLIVYYYLQDSLCAFPPYTVLSLHTQSSIYPTLIISRLLTRLAKPLSRTRRSNENQRGKKTFFTPSFIPKENKCTILLAYKTTTITVSITIYSMLSVNVFPIFPIFRSLLGPLTLLDRVRSTFPKSHFILLLALLPVLTDCPYLASTAFFCYNSLLSQHYFMLPYLILTSFFCQITIHI